MLHHEQPSVSFRLLIRAGAMQEPADKPGVASFVGALLNQGTTTRSSQEIANAIESAGGAVGVGSGNELSYVNGAVIKDQVDLVLGLASDMVQHPAFAPEEIDRQRKQMLSSLQVSYDDPDYIADLVFDRLVFGFHPYGRPNEGTPQSIGRITRDDLVAFTRTWFVPNNALLAVVGDLTADEAFAAADKGVWRLGDARRAGRQARRPAAADAARRRRSIGRDPRRPKSARVSWASPTTIRSTCRSTSRSAFWAARARTGCSACCARIAA